MLTKIRTFVKKEAVFCISALCAIGTMFFIPPDSEYIHYIDFRVLSILFCLMAVVAGFKKSGVFNALTYQILSRIKSGRLLGITLVMLPFFASMLVTNDVALIVFVPFAISLLTGLGCSKNVVPLIVLQTVAANLGSMATPVGNPQNLFIYSTYSLSADEFFRVTLPLTAVSFVLLLIISIPVLPEKLEVGELKEKGIDDKKRFAVYCLLFVLALLTVFRILPYQITTPVTVVVFAIVNRDLFKEIDFMLLLTFVCFFIISENLGRIEVIRSFLQNLLEKNTILAGIGTSQIISNVPAAVLMSSFTDNWKELLVSVNIGGLGTPVASLASLITLKLYMASEKARIGNFLAVFTAANILGLAVLIIFTFLTK